MKLYYSPLFALLSLSGTSVLNAEARRLKAGKATPQYQDSSPQDSGLPQLNGFPAGSNKLVIGIGSSGMMGFSEGNVGIYRAKNSLNRYFGLSSMAVDIFDGLSDVCEFEVEVVLTNGCSQSLGAYHACGSQAPRDEGGFLIGGQDLIMANSVDFAVPFAYSEAGKPSHVLLTRLENGLPVIDGSNNLRGVNVGFIYNYEDEMEYLWKNTCTNERFEEFNFINSAGTLVTYSNDGFDPFAPPPPPSPPGPEKYNLNLENLLNGVTDALFIDNGYVEGVCDANSDFYSDGSGCEDGGIWTKFGTEFATIQTGVYTDFDGAPLGSVFFRKGAGIVEEFYEPCLEAFMETEAFDDICTEYKAAYADDINNEGLECITNDTPPNIQITRRLASQGYTCADGYCPCPA